MQRPTLTRESRCLVIAAGWCLERRIEDRARAIAASRSADDISPEDIERATAEFFREELSDLPRLVRQAMNDYRHASTKAA
ncbi:MAG: hypothetical protein NTW96_25840 [Planctomycetia bacterium]|nr:hypothetical protein [Planctomycetia bacterium]